MINTIGLPIFNSPGDSLHSSDIAFYLEDCMNFKLLGMNGHLTS